jgi:ABC-type dipeptide/oligopeptide/nickel transport system permease component
LASRARAVASRLAEGLLTAVAISFLSSILLLLSRGDVAVAAVQERGAPVTVEAVASERARLGLDLPFLERYLNFLERAVHGDFGVSVRTGHAVWGDIAERLGPTLVLAAAGSAVAVVVALAVGLGEALSPVGAVRGVSRALTLVLVSVPGFALAFLLVSVVSLRWGWLPTQGTGSVRTLVLPALVLGLPAGAALGRVLSTRLREVLGEPYLVTARAQGFSHRTAVVRWALPNAGVTTLVVGGNILAALASGTLVVEELFGWPGIGSYLVDSLRYRDGFALQASILVLSVLIIGVRMASLLMATLLDPRAGSNL